MKFHFFIIQISKMKVLDTEIYVTQLYKLFSFTILNRNDCKNIYKLLLQRKCLSENKFNYPALFEYNNPKKFKDDCVPRG